MANGAADPTRLGQDNQTGSALALFKVNYITDVITEYRKRLVAAPRILNRTIESGKSASFPVMGDLSAVYHTPGDDLMDAGNSYLQKARHSEELIYINGFLTSPSFIPSIDEAMSHVDYRRFYAQKAGQALAEQDDEFTFRTLLKAARASARYTGAPTGGTISAGATVETSGTVLGAAIRDAVVDLWENNIPQGADIYCAVRPEQYHLLVEDEKENYDRDYAGQGSFQQMRLPMVGGAKLLMSNNIPSDNRASDDANQNNVYTGNNTNTVAVVWCPEAAGKLTLRGVKLDMSYKDTHLGWFLNPHMAVGHGVLRGECAIEISKA